jgi:hypothetical protein
VSDKYQTDVTDRNKQKTTSMLKEHETEASPILMADTVDLGAIRPWRIALLIKQVQVELIITLTTTLSIGRSDPKSDIQPNIDLKPFGAENLGVSRRHLAIRLESDGVVVEDLHSVNGTKLNGNRLEPGRNYPVRHSDQLVLGGMELQVQVLLNPLE